MEPAKRRLGSIDSFFAAVPAAKRGRDEAAAAAPAAATDCDGAAAGTPSATAEGEDALTVREREAGMPPAERFFRLVRLTFSLYRRPQTEQRRRAEVNKALALARKAHASACAVADAARRDSRNPALRELLVWDDWTEAWAPDMSRESFKALEAVRA